MFRLTGYEKRLLGGNASGKRSSAPSANAPIVIWNLTRTCNLDCVHCYASSKMRDFSGELSPEQAINVVEQLHEAGVSNLVLSGGEPLYREDLFEIAKRAKEFGFLLTLSSNGTLIKDKEADLLRDAKFDYIGVSLDGIGEMHDKFRGLEGAFDLAVDGLLRCRDRGLRVGVRFTPTQMNVSHLPGIFEFVEKNRINKIYLSHLVYSGRGISNQGEDLTVEQTRETVKFIFEKSAEYVKNGVPIEVVTGNNDADAVFYFQTLMNKDPEVAEKILPYLEKWGGNNAGIGVANIDPLGNVHPDPLMSNINLGNVREDTFKNIWFNSEHPVLKQLRQRPRVLNGRCGKCEFIRICGGNSRTRTERATGDLMGSDPACYLTDEEVLNHQAGAKI